MIVHLKAIIILSCASGGPRKPSKTFWDNLIHNPPLTFKKIKLEHSMLARLQVEVGSWSQQQMHLHNLYEPELHALQTSTKSCTHVRFVQRHLNVAASRTPAPISSQPAGQATGQDGAQD
jgi:hypothetical protein